MLTLCAAHECIWITPRHLYPRKREHITLLIEGLVGPKTPHLGAQRKLLLLLQVEIF
jgi:hypothetical protein